MHQSENANSEEWRTIKGYEGHYMVSNLGKIKSLKNGERLMNSLHMFKKEFPNGWGFDIKHNPDGFGDMYSTDYPYSVRTYNRKAGFANFKNFQYPSEVFAYIAEVQKW